MTFHEKDVIPLLADLCVDEDMNVAIDLNVSVPLAVGVMTAILLAPLVLTPYGFMLGAVVSWCMVGNSKRHRPVWHLLIHELNAEQERKLANLFNDIVARSGIEPEDVLTFERIEPEQRLKTKINEQIRPEVIQMVQNFVRTDLKSTLA